MSGHALTRRSFLVGSAGVAAVAAGAGLVSLSVRGEADADAETDKRTEVVHSLCNSCSSKCGYYAYVVDGELTKLIGDEAHPNAQGKLCARGYGYSQIAYSPDRLTDPMKKNENGEFEVIGWDQALSEIGQKVNDIIAQYGPEALAMVQDPRPSGKYYTKRFMNALGSPNVYTHGAACNLSKESGFTQAIGAANFESDVANSKMTMFIGRSYADAIRPSSVVALQKAHEKGAHIVLVDPRLNNSIAFADEWVPINPGTDLALILAMSNVLINRDLYDAEYVAANSVGFDEWASAIAGYTPEWAEGITGIPAATIERLALEFAEAAPAASIEPSWRGAFGCSYANSGETARALCLFNTLLGCWNQPGGALFLPSVKAGDLDPAKFPEVPKVEAKMWGAEEYPLALSSMGTNLYVAEMAKEGNVKGLFFYNSNMAAGYSNPAQLAEDFANLDLMVVVDVQMSETAMLADYVLPECSYLERRELPEFVGGRVPVVSLRDQVLEVIHPNTRPADVIFTQLAEACGVGQYFPFTVDELAERARVPVQKLKHRALTNTWEVGGVKVLLMKPVTYMNLSGEAVGEAARFYKLPPERVLVISDDVSLPVGKLRIRKGGSAGGHNGLKSIIQHLGTDQFPRIKVGVGQKPHPDYDMADWVLSKFAGEDLKTITEAIRKAADAVECLIQEGPDKAMNRFNG